MNRLLARALGALFLAACTRSTSGVTSDSSRGRSSASSSTDVSNVPPAPTPESAGASAPEIQMRPAKKHRAAAKACPRARGPGKSNWGPEEDCKSDAACKSGQNGRCLQIGLGTHCSYDTCYADKDCMKDGASGVCDCRESEDSPSPNRCVVGNCRLDADCNGWSCSPSIGPMGRVNGVVGYYCHGPHDTCMDDEDCGGRATCRYESTAGRFKCGSSEVRPG